MAKDLQMEFGKRSGYSTQNLWYMRQFYNTYRDKPNLQQLVGEIPWGHNIAIFQKNSEITKALFYVQQTMKNGWSRSVLVHQIESRLYERSGKAITNFSNTLLSSQSDLANEIVKDPYNFDFLTMTDIGILLCKGKDKTLVEYSLSDIHKPMGVSEYQLTHLLPDELKSSLPTIEELELELKKG